jgi:hypothetical protein
VKVLEAKTALQHMNTFAENYEPYKIWQCAVKLKNNRLEAVLNEQEPGREKYRNNITYRTLRISL